jgi:hypothetical protein
LYAVEIELWKIDTSKPALRFNVLSQPTEIARDAMVIKTAGLITDTKKLQLEFWTRFRAHLLEQKVVISAQQLECTLWDGQTWRRSNGDLPGVFLFKLSRTFVSER